MSELPDQLDLTEWWKAQADHFPMLYKIALPMIQVPVASCEAERSFSQYADILSDDHQSLSEDSIHTLSMLKWNGDLQ